MCQKLTSSLTCTSQYGGGKSLHYHGPHIFLNYIPTQATSSEVRWGNTPDAIRNARAERRSEEDKRRTPKDDTRNPKFAKQGESQTSNSKKAVRQDAQLYAARIELEKACSTSRFFLH